MLCRPGLELFSICSPIQGTLDSLAGDLVKTVARDADRRSGRPGNCLVTVWLTPPARRPPRPGRARLGAGSRRPGQRKADASAAVQRSGVAGRGAMVRGAVPREAPSLSIGALSIRLPVTCPCGFSSLFQSAWPVGGTLSAAIVVHEHAEFRTVPSTAVIDLGLGPAGGGGARGSGGARVLRPRPHAWQGGRSVPGPDLAAGEQVLVEGGFKLPEGTAVETSADGQLIAEEAAVATGQRGPGHERRRTEAPVAMSGPSQSWIRAAVRPGEKLGLAPGRP